MNTLLIAVAALASTLTACGGAGGGAASTSFTPSAPAPVTVAAATKIVAVVGDSISKIAISTPTACVTQAGNTCAYVQDGSVAYPAYIATDTGAQVVNLAVAGATILYPHVIGSTSIPPILSSQVPQIPANATDVIFEGGTNDISIDGSAEGQLQRIDEVMNAIQQQAPNAKIIFVGVRNFAGCNTWNVLIDTCRPGSVAAWNAREAEDALVSHGAFVDISKAWPDGISGAWPDGTHPSQTVTPLIARMIEPYL